MAPTYPEQITVRLSERQAEAIASHCATIGAPVSTWARIILTREIPPEHWKPLAPPEGQLTIPGSTGDASSPSEPASSSGSSSPSVSTG